MGASSPVETYRFCGTIGYEGRTNDLVYCYPSTRTKERTTVVYFGGDMQVRIMHSKLVYLLLLQLNPLFRIFPRTWKAIGTVKII